MKAKRLRALLVAGLLSLAPAVTLTSCSGGGGGGGGGGDAGSGAASGADGSGESSEVASLSRLSGQTLRCNLSAAYQTIEFRDSGLVVSTYINPSDSSKNASYSGTYQTPNTLQMDGVSVASTVVNLQDTVTGYVEQWRIFYTIENGRFKTLEVYASFADDGSRDIASKCYFE